MKRVKTLAAILLGVALLASVAPAMAQSAAYRHYVACGLSQNAKPAHVCQKTPQQGRLLPQHQRRRLLHGLRQIPDQTPLRAEAGGDEGDPLRQQDHLEHPRPAQGDLVRRRQTGRPLRLQGEGLARPAGDPRLRHGDGRHRRRRRARRRGPLRVAARPLREGEPAAHDGAAGRGRARGRGGRRLGRVRGGRGRASARAPSPACGSGSRRRGRWAPSRGLPRGRRRHPRCARPRDRRGGDGGESRSPSSTRGAARSSRRSTRRRRAGLGPVRLPAGGARRADRGAVGKPPLAAGSGAVRFREELAGRGVEIPDDADPVHRIAARHICALAAAGAGVEAEPAAPNYLRPPDAERWRERDTIPDSRIAPAASRRCAGSPTATCRR